MVPYPVRRLVEEARLVGLRARRGYYGARWREARENRRRLAEVRRARKPSPEQPLVSVVIATYNRGALLVERSVKSALAQTYPNVEVVVVGDHCTDDTVERMAQVKDPRVRFENLAERGKYPTDPLERWYVAGVVPVQRAIDLARGEWIAYLDDDDEFTPDHVEVLLAAAKKKDAELVYGVVRMQMEEGDAWKLVGSEPLRLGHVSRISLMHRKDVGFIENDLHCWRWKEPADWNLMRRMKDAGVRIAFADQVVGIHYVERKNWGR